MQRRNQCSLRILVLVNDTVDRFPLLICDINCTFLLIQSYLLEHSKSE